MTSAACRCLANLLLLAVAVAIDGCAQREQAAGGRTAEEWVEIGSSEYGSKWTLRARGVPGGSGLLRAVPGTTWSVDFELRLEMASHVPAMGRFKRVLVAVFGELRHDASGAYRASSSDYQLSSAFTTTGIPIDTADHWPQLRILHGRNGSPFEGVAGFPIPTGEDLSDQHVFQGRIDVPIPTDLERGYWEPFVAVLVDVEGVSVPVFLDMFELTRKETWFPSLPLVQVGEVSPPRLPWTAFPDSSRGLRGTLDEATQEHVGLIVRGAFPNQLVVEPGTHKLGPGLPTIFPRQALPLITELQTAFPKMLPGHWDLDRGEVSCVVEGPNGRVDLGTRKTAGALSTRRGEDELALEGGPLWADLNRTGTYRVRLTGFLPDRFGRRFAGGGTYQVHVAKPLSFSTSCKPGTSFLAGGRYPPKVNVIPPVPADVEVLVEYYPQSSRERKQTWTTRGLANRFGHFARHDVPPITFDEPGEYRSRVTATYRDPQGELWMGIQTSSGVIAPVEPSTIRLHGSQGWRDGTYPTLRAPDDPQTYEGLYHQAESIVPALSSGIAEVIDPTLPYHDRDTLFITSSYPLVVELEARFSLSVSDERLAGLLRRASAIPARPLPRRNQKLGEWRYVENILERGYGWQGLIWSPIPPGLRIELPIEWVSGGELHPVNFPRDTVLEAYTYFGAVRPGLLVLLGVVTKDGHASHWQSGGNDFSNHINAGFSGDEPGDVYRVQAGVVVKDRETGINHYDVYSSAMAFLASPDNTSSVLPAGAKPLVEEGGRKHYVFLASDTHDCLEVGEQLAVGGMVFPNVPAGVTWTVTPPEGDDVVIRGRANRMGMVAGDRMVAADRPGMYRVHVRVEHEGLVGGVVGTRDDTYWVCAVEHDAPGLLDCPLPRAGRIDPAGDARIELSWPKDLRNARVHYAAIMPGRVIEQGVVQVDGVSWTYRFSPVEAKTMIPNFDSVDYASGVIEPRPSETVVFQFVLEGEDASGKRWDARRIVLRKDLLLNPGGREPPEVRPEAGAQTDPRP